MRIHAGEGRSDGSAPGHEADEGGYRGSYRPHAAGRSPQPERAVRAVPEPVALWRDQEHQEQGDGVNSFDHRSGDERQAVIFIPNRDQALRRALVLRQLAEGRRRRLQRQEKTP